MKDLIPSGAQTFSKSPSQFPKNAPQFLDRGEGAYVWDVDGVKYLDFISGLCSITLGYCDPDVNRAVEIQLNKGASFSLPNYLEVKVAEKLVDLIPCAEMVKFGKNGSDVTTAAIRLARAYTGRDKVVMCGYHGWHDWSIGTISNIGHKGVPDKVKALTSTFEYNDIMSLKSALYYEKIACIIMEPVRMDLPVDGFLEEVRRIVTKSGALLIFDEMITGFRYSLGGAQEYYGVTPDLATFGKGMANGFPLSALVGRRDIMCTMKDVFYSTTFGGETLSLAAALATINKMQKENVIDHLWNIGTDIMVGVNGLLVKHQLHNVIKIKGTGPWSLLQTTPEVKTYFMQEMLKEGILISMSHNISYAHTKKHVEELLTAYDKVLGRISNNLNQLSEVIEGPVIEDIFKVR